MFITVSKVIGLYMESQYVRHHMAKQTLNANINSPSGIYMNVDYVYGGAVEIWSSIDADICDVGLIHQ